VDVRLSGAGAAPPRSEKRDMEAAKAFFAQAHEVAQDWFFQILWCRGLKPVSPLCSIGIEFMMP